MVGGVAFIFVKYVSLSCFNMVIFRLGAAACAVLLDGAFAGTFAGKLAGVFAARMLQLMATQHGSQSLR